MNVEYYKFFRVNKSGQIISSHQNHAARYKAARKLEDWLHGMGDWNTEDPIFAEYQRRYDRLPNAQTITWSVGQVHRATGPIELCNNGFHASANVYDAWNYVQGRVLGRVSAWGDMDTSRTKIAARFMRLDEAYLVRPSFDGVLAYQLCGIPEMLDARLIKPYTEREARW